MVSAYWLLFNGNNLLIKVVDETVIFPVTDDLKTLNIEIERKHYIGKLHNNPCYVAEVTGVPPLPDGFNFIGMRQLFETIDESLFRVAGQAYEIINWDCTQRFCGRCGTLNEDKKDERAKICPNCGLVSFPRISPAVIVAVIKDNQILLARNKKFTSNYYSVIAGFVEAGETLEECIKREIREEVGIEVKNIKYFGSQPWPFPDSLMMAFTAEYDAGEITVDNHEILEAHWFTADNLPDLPNKKTIARQLIDWFIKRQGLTQN
ncbi:NAD(+) diphosphatase [Desulfotomaculum nigrificans]|uniref:NAD(+) diphosphatase n=1 Tax=Desulfotomaculum nigrificans TaxID=1565 RepID=UPI0001FAE46E|nr:NAD(+) diphosphatase [Desulfotomaculum nigrificans]